MFKMTSVELVSNYTEGRRDFRGADLSLANLSLANLSGADFSGANLSLANLSGANLLGADLSGVDLSCANLSGADLSLANLSGVDLSCADLSGANLSGASLSGVDLSCADLSGATGIVSSSFFGVSGCEIALAMALQRRGACHGAFTWALGRVPNRETFDAAPRQWIDWLGNSATGRKARGQVSYSRIMKWLGLKKPKTKVRS